MPNMALFSKTRIPLLMEVIDGYPDETHTLETRTGGEPLEDGARVTDHAVADVERLKLTAFVSDFGGPDRPREAWETLRRLHREVAPLEVYTDWGYYPEMILKRITGEQVGRGMQVHLELEHIIRVGVAASQLTPEQLSGAAEGRSGEIERGRVNLED